MCEANAYYIDENGKEEVLMKDVDKIIPEDNKYVLRDIYGEQKFIAGEIKEISLLNHKIIFKAT